MLGDVLGVGGGGGGGVLGSFEREAQDAVSLWSKNRDVVLFLSIADSSWLCMAIDSCV